MWVSPSLPPDGCLPPWIAMLSQAQSGTLLLPAVTLIP